MPGSRGPVSAAGLVQACLLLPQSATLSARERVLPFSGVVVRKSTHTERWLVGGHVGHKGIHTYHAIRQVLVVWRDRRGPASMRSAHIAVGPVGPRRARHTENGPD